MDDPKEVKIPAALLGISLLVFLGYGLLAGGAGGAVAVLIVLGAQLVVGICLGILACMVTARLMSTSFGPLNTAILKLAAVFAFPTAIAAVIPVIGGLVALALYWGLLTWLFDLEGMEVVVCTFVIWVVRFVALIIGAMMVAPFV